jgi:hypothetical protein
LKLTDAYIINSKNRKENDFYPTAPVATQSLIENCNIPKTIWEPCAGKGHISKELIRNGFDVFSSDLFSYNDSLISNIKTDYDFQTCDLPDVEGVITNPPFKSNLPQKLIERCLDKYSFIAIFCRLTFMESGRRYNLFKNNPPSKILVFSERVNCDEKLFYPKEKQIGGMVAYAWFIWDKNLNETNKIDWIKPSDYLNKLEN